MTNFNPSLICNYELQSIGFTLMDRVLQSQMSGCQNSFAKVELINTDKLLCNIIHAVLILWWEGAKREAVFGHYLNLFQHQTSLYSPDREKLQLKLWNLYEHNKISIT